MSIFLFCLKLETSVSKHDDVTIEQLYSAVNLKISGAHFTVVLYIPSAFFVVDYCLFSRGDGVVGLLCVGSVEHNVLSFVLDDFAVNLLSLVGNECKCECRSVFFYRKTCASHGAVNKTCRQFGIAVLTPHHFAFALVVSRRYIF